MRNSKPIIRFALTLLLALPVALQAQNSSLNAFSPYTFYGIGDFHTQGPAFMRSMGGAGIGFRNALKINYLNPASYSILRQKTFLFNVGLEGNNVYSKTSSARTSHNSFNVRDLAIALPLGKSIGIGVSVTPLSSVGYHVQMSETDPEYLAADKYVIYNYTGEGDVTQAKLGLGLLTFKRLSLGADLIYYHGRISRSYTTSITPILSSGSSYNSVMGQATETISRIGMNFGMQYDLILNEDRILTFGATYRPRLNLKPESQDRIYTGGIDADTILYSNGKKDFVLPGTLTTGLSYQTMKIGIALDYSWEQWTGSNPTDLTNDIVFKNNHFVKAGFQITPNPIDIRHPLNRWSYRVGIRFNDYYMRINNRKINDLAITAGVGIPLRIQGMSAVNVGLEWGRRGTTASGMIGTRQFQMVRENYVKLSIGLSLFGEDDWFKRFKYQ